MLAIFTSSSPLYNRCDWRSFANVYTKSNRWTWHVGFGWLVEETNSPFLIYDLRANHCGYLLVVTWDFRWIITYDLLVRISLSDLPQRAVVRSYAYLRALFGYVYMTVVGWALCFRRIPVCHAVDMILSLKKSTFEKCSCFSFMRRLIFTNFCNTLWTQFNCRAQRNARLLVVTVTKSVHAVCLIFISWFSKCRMPTVLMCSVGCAVWVRGGAIPVFVFSWFP